MSRVDFGEDRVAALVSELTASGQEFLFFPADKFWKRFGLSNGMRELQAQVAEKLRALGVETAFEVSVNLPDEEVQAAFTAEKMQAVVDAVTAEENQALFLLAQDFWGHFGVDDTMSELQSIAAEKFRALGLSVTFEVGIGFLDEEEGKNIQGMQPAMEGDPFTPDRLAELVNSAAQQENQQLFLGAQGFWEHFGLADRMREAQLGLSEQLAAAGAEVSFDVILSLPAPELPLTMAFDAPARPAPLDLNVATVRALSIRQPWVELILRGEKNLEYRSRRMKEMGPLLIHASRTLDESLFEGRDLDPQTLPFGALVGVVDVVGCVAVEGEEGLFAYQLAYPRRFKTPVPYSGAAGIFRVPVTEVRAALAGGPGLTSQTSSDTLEQ